MKVEKMKIHYLLYIFAVASLVSFNTCSESDKVFRDETQTKGNIKIAVDDSYRLLLDTQIYTFESLYTNAHINPIYGSELEILDLFMKDSVRLMVTNRPLTSEEVEYLKSYQIIGRTTKIAYDAVAFIVNSNNKDSLIKYTHIKEIFAGNIDNWKQINPTSKLEKLKVVFDNEKSANVRFIKEKFEMSTKFPTTCQAVSNNEEVVKYVESHENAIGLISVNWISDRADSISNAFLKRVQVLAITNEIDPNGDNYYRPYQGYIADKSYPFIRDVYTISRETFSGLGSGFISFVAGEKGQRIILKSGMVPAVMPVRLVQIKSN